MKYLLNSLMALLLLMVVACGPTAETSEAATETMEETTEETATTETEEEEKEEDKSQRPSPPQTAEGTIGEATVTINYGAPSLKGREIGTDFVPYGKIWRTGANEATTIEFSKDVTVEGQPLAAGKYALFTIPGEEKWTVIFNKEFDQWGAYNYKEDQDALRVEVATASQEEATEMMTFSVTDGQFALHWGNTVIPVAVQ